jgi:hypothetical protein
MVKTRRVLSFDPAAVSERGFGVGDREAVV